MKRHDENKDLRSFSRIGKVNYGDKTLQASRSATIGIHMWGKIDYLTHYCGWHFMYNNSIGVGTVNVNTDNSTENTKSTKKSAKEHKLTDKTKRKK
jgi:hypothetical protein